MAAWQVLEQFKNWAQEGVDLPEAPPAQPPGRCRVRFFPSPFPMTGASRPGFPAKRGADCAGSRLLVES
jgi:hypothetical protein